MTTETLYATMDINIEHFCRSVRAFRALWQININTMSDLHSYIQQNGTDALTRIHGVGSYTEKVILAFYESFMEKHIDYLGGGSFE